MISFDETCHLSSSGGPEVLSEKGNAGQKGCCLTLRTSTPPLLPPGDPPYIASPALSHAHILLTYFPYHIHFIAPLSPSSKEGGDG
jgi:hypothetical protein